MKNDNRMYNKIPAVIYAPWLFSACIHVLYLNALSISLCSFVFSILHFFTIKNYKKFHFTNFSFPNFFLLFKKKSFIFILMFLGEKKIHWNKFSQNIHNIHSFNLKEHDKEIISYFSWKVKIIFYFITNNNRMKI